MATVTNKKKVFERRRKI